MFVSYSFPVFITLNLVVKLLRCYKKELIISVYNLHLMRGFLVVFLFYLDDHRLNFLLPKTNTSCLEPLCSSNQRETVISSSPQQDVC